MRAVSEARRNRLDTMASMPVSASPSARDSTCRRPSGASGGSLLPSKARWFSDMPWRISRKDRVRGGAESRRGAGCRGMVISPVLLGRGDETEQHDDLLDLLDRAEAIAGDASNAAAEILAHQRDDDQAGE